MNSIGLGESLGCGVRGRAEASGELDGEPDRTLDFGVGQGAHRAEQPDRGRLTVDRAALREALGGNGDLVETLEAKATGRPGANAAVMWRYYVQCFLMRSGQARRCTNTPYWPRPTWHNYRRWRRAISLSGGVKLPFRRLGGMTASRVSSLSTGSARR